MEVLQISGGKDSLACLELLRAKLDHITVMWLNTGSAFPEVLEQMDKIRASVPHFMEVKSDAMADIERHGWPADLVPTEHTGWGQLSTGTQGIKLRSWVECCRNNFWEPLDAACKQLGATRVYRGQRDSERYKSPIRSGTVIDGIEYVFPIQSWSTQQVMQYLVDKGVEVPRYYQFTGTSLDCWNCTAYLDAKLGQMRYMRRNHPEKFAFVSGKLKEIAQACASSISHLAEGVEL